MCPVSRHHSSSKSELSSPSGSDSSATKTSTDHSYRRRKRRRYTSTSSSSSSDYSPRRYLKELLYYCVYCQDESGADISCNGTIKEIYAHWLTTHASETTPFRFYVSKIVGCYYCEKNGTFHELKTHAKEHGENGIVVVNKRIGRKCGLCTFHDSGMVDHFDSHQSAIKLDVFNPVRMPTEMIRELRLIDVHEKRKCKYCDAIFETDNGMELHHLAQHPMLEMQYEDYYDGITAYYVCHGCKEKVERNDFFEHLKDHEFDFKCSMCDFRCRKLLDIVEHDKRVHGMNSFNYHSSKLTDSMVNCYLSTKTVFGNGFVLNNVNIIGTKYDESSEFIDFAETSIKRMKELYNTQN